MDMKHFGSSPSRRVSDGSMDRNHAAFELWREPARKPSSPIALDPMSAFLFLRRNFLRIALVWLIVAVAAFGASLLIFNKYSATAIVMIDPRTAKVTQAGGVLSNIGADAIAIESLVQTTSSNSFLEALVNRLDLAKDPDFAGREATAALNRAATIEKLDRKLSIARRGTTYVVDVTVSSPSAQKSARIANAAAQMIIDDQSRLREGASEKTAKDIEVRLAELRGRLGRAEENFAELKAKLKVTDAGQGSTSLERRVFELTQQSVLAGARTAETRARFEQLRKAGASSGDNLSPAAQSSVLNALRAEYARLSRQSADQATVLGGQHPEVASLRAQIGDVRRQIGAELARMMATARTDFLEAEQREASLARQLKDTQAESGALGPELVKLAQLDREARAERNVYEQLLTRQRELIQTKDLEPSDIRIVSPAIPPTRTKPGKALLAVVSAALGLLAGLGYALARELSRTTLKTARQAERVAGAPVLAIAPLMTAPPPVEGAKPRRPDLSPWLTDLSGACMDIDARRDGRVILVSSVRGGEGRSTIAASLAAYFAHGDGRVVLIEADRPNGRRRFGLIDVLERGEDLERALVERPLEGYTLLPFGGRDADERAPTSALMNGVTLRAALTLLRRWFDIIVIDGPPALGSSHAKTLAREADLTALVVEWDKTVASDARAALDRLDARESTLVINKVVAERYRLFEPEQSRRLAEQAEAHLRAA